VKRNWPTLPSEAPWRIVIATGIGMAPAQVLSLNVTTNPSIPGFNDVFNLNTNGVSVCG
jgi:hypothetical protein